MSEIIEGFFTGYCKNFDMTQTVICEYEQLADGLHFLSSSCEYGTCIHSENCNVMQQALNRQKNK